MEMLIVVAIIAVLVAIAIPVFMSQLDKARAQSDAANIRSGYAAVMAEVLTNTPSAATTYHLNNDGSATTTATSAYTCQGASTNLENNEKIGGQTVTWAKNEGQS